MATEDADEELVVEGLMFVVVVVAMAIFVGVYSSFAEAVTFVTFTSASSSNVLKRVPLRQKSCHPTEAEDTRRFFVGEAIGEASSLTVPREYVPSSLETGDDSFLPPSIDK